MSLGQPGSSSLNVPQGEPSRDWPAIESDIGSLAQKIDKRVNSLEVPINAEFIRLKIQTQKDVIKFLELLIAKVSSPIHKLYLSVWKKNISAGLSDIYPELATQWLLRSAGKLIELRGKLFGSYIESMGADVTADISEILINVVNDLSENDLIRLGEGKRIDIDGRIDAIQRVAPQPIVAGRPDFPSLATEAVEFLHNIPLPNVQKEFITRFCSDKGLKDKESIMHLMDSLITAYQKNHPNAFIGVYFRILKAAFSLESGAIPDAVAFLKIVGKTKLNGILFLAELDTNDLLNIKFWYDYWADAVEPWLSKLTPQDIVKINAKGAVTIAELDEIALRGSQLANLDTAKPTNLEASVATLQDAIRNANGKPNEYGLILVAVDAFLKDNSDENALERLYRDVLPLITKLQLRLQLTIHVKTVVYGFQDGGMGVAYIYGAIEDALKDLIGFLPSSEHDVSTTPGFKALYGRIVEILIELNTYDDLKNKNVWLQRLRAASGNSLKVQDTRVGKTAEELSLEAGRLVDKFLNDKIAIYYSDIISELLNPMNEKSFNKQLLLQLAIQILNAPKVNNWSLLLGIVLMYQKLDSASLENLQSAVVAEVKTLTGLIEQVRKDLKSDLDAILPSDTQSDTIPGIDVVNKAIGNALVILMRDHNANLPNANDYGLFKGLLLEELKKITGFTGYKTDVSSSLKTVVASSAPSLPGQADPGAQPEPVLAADALVDDQAGSYEQQYLEIVEDIKALFEDGKTGQIKDALKIIEANKLADKVAIWVLEQFIQRLPEKDWLNLWHFVLLQRKIAARYGDSGKKKNQDPKANKLSQLDAKNLQDKGKKLLELTTRIKQTAKDKATSSKKIKNQDADDLMSKADQKHNRMQLRIEAAVWEMYQALKKDSQRADALEQQCLGAAIKEFAKDPSQDMSNISELFANKLEQKLLELKATPQAVVALVPDANLATNSSAPDESQFDTKVSQRRSILERIPAGEIQILFNLIAPPGINLEDKINGLIKFIVDHNLTKDDLSALFDDFLGRVSFQERDLAVLLHAVYTRGPTEGVDSILKRINATVRNVQLVYINTGKKYNIYQDRELMPILVKMIWDRAKDGLALDDESSMQSQMEAQILEKRAELLANQIMSDSFINNPAAQEAVSRNFIVDSGINPWQNRWSIIDRVIDRVSDVDLKIRAIVMFRMIELIPGAMPDAEGLYKASQVWRKLGLIYQDVVTNNPGIDTEKVLSWLKQIIMTNTLEDLQDEDFVFDRLENMMNQMPGSVPPSRINSPSAPIGVLTPQAPQAQPRLIEDGLINNLRGLLIVNQALVSPEKVIDILSQMQYMITPTNEPDWERRVIDELAGISSNLEDGFKIVLAFRSLRMGPGFNYKKEALAQFNEELATFIVVARHPDFRNTTKDNLFQAFISVIKGATSTRNLNDADILKQRVDNHLYAARQQQPLVQTPPAPALSQTILNGLLNRILSGNNIDNHWLMFHEIGQFIKDNSINSGNVWSAVDQLLVKVTEPTKKLKMVVAFRFMQENYNGLKSDSATRLSTDYDAAIDIFTDRAYAQIDSNILARFLIEAIKDNRLDELELGGQVHQSLDQKLTAAGLLAVQPPSQQSTLSAGQSATSMPPMQPGAPLNQVLPTNVAIIYGTLNSRLSSMLNMNPLNTLYLDTVKRTFLDLGIAIGSPDYWANAERVILEFTDQNDQVKAAIILNFIGNGNRNQPDIVAVYNIVRGLIVDLGSTYNLNDVMTAIIGVMLANNPIAVVKDRNKLEPLVVNAIQNIAGSAPLRPTAASQQSNAVINQLSQPAVDNVVNVLKFKMRGILTPGNYNGASSLQAVMTALTSLGINIGTPEAWAAARQIIAEFTNGDERIDVAIILNAINNQGVTQLTNALNMKVAVVDVLRDLAANNDPDEVRGAVLDLLQTDTPVAYLMDAVRLKPLVLKAITQVQIQNNQAPQITNPNFNRLIAMASKLGYFDNHYAVLNEVKLFMRQNSLNAGNIWGAVDQILQGIADPLSKLKMLVAFKFVLQDRRPSLTDSVFNLMLAFDSAEEIFADQAYAAFDKLVLLTQLIEAIKEEKVDDLIADQNIRENLNRRLGLQVTLPVGTVQVGFQQPPTGVATSLVGQGATATRPLRALGTPQTPAATPTGGNRAAVTGAAINPTGAPAALPILPPGAGNNGLGGQNPRGNAFNNQPPINPGPGGQGPVGINQPPIGIPPQPPVGPNINQSPIGPQQVANIGLAQQPTLDQETKEIFYRIAKAADALVVKDVNIEEAATIVNEAMKGKSDSKLYEAWQKTLDVLIIKVENVAGFSTDKKEIREAKHKLIDLYKLQAVINAIGHSAELILLNQKFKDKIRSKSSVDSIVPSFGVPKVLRNNNMLAEPAKTLVELADVLQAKDLIAAFAQYLVALTPTQAVVLEMYVNFEQGKLNQVGLSKVLAIQMFIANNIASTTVAGGDKVKLILEEIINIMELTGPLDVFNSRAGGSQTAPTQPAGPVAVQQVQAPVAAVAQPLAPVQPGGGPGVQLPQQPPAQPAQPAQPNTPNIVGGFRDFQQNANDAMDLLVPNRDPLVDQMLAPVIRTLQAGMWQPVATHQKALSVFIPLFRQNPPAGFGPNIGQLLIDNWDNGAIEFFLEGYMAAFAQNNIQGTHLHAFIVYLADKMQEGVLVIQRAGQTVDEDNIRQQLEQILAAPQPTNGPLVTNRIVPIAAQPIVPAPAPVVVAAAQPIVPPAAPRPVNPAAAAAPIAQQNPPLAPGTGIGFDLPPERRLFEKFDAAIRRHREGLRQANGYWEKVRKEGWRRFESFAVIVAALAATHFAAQGITAGAEQIIQDPRVLDWLKQLDNLGPLVEDIVVAGVGAAGLFLFQPVGKVVSMVVNRAIDPGPGQFYHRAYNKAERVQRDRVMGLLYNKVRDLNEGRIIFLDPIFEDKFRTVISEIGNNVSVQTIDDQINALMTEQFANPTQQADYQQVIDEVRQIRQEIENWELLVRTDVSDGAVAGGKASPFLEWFRPINNLRKLFGRA